MVELAFTALGALGAGTAVVGVQLLAPQSKGQADWMIQAVNQDSLDTTDGLPLRPYDPRRPWDCNELSEFPAVRLLQQSTTRVVTVAALPEAPASKLTKAQLIALIPESMSVFPPAKEMSERELRIFLSQHNIKIPDTPPHWDQEEISKGLRHNTHWRSMLRPQPAGETPEVRSYSASKHVQERYLWATKEQLAEHLPTWIDHELMSRDEVISALDLYDVVVPVPTLEQIGFTQIDPREIERMEKIETDNMKTDKIERQINLALQAMKRGDLHADDSRRMVQKLQAELNEES